MRLANWRGRLLGRPEPRRIADIRGGEGAGVEAEAGEAAGEELWAADRAGQTVA